MLYPLKIAQQGTAQNQGTDPDLLDLQDEQFEFPSSDTILFKSPGLKKKLRKVQAEREKKLREKEAEKLKTETAHIEKQQVEIEKLEEAAKALKIQAEKAAADSIKREEIKKQTLAELQKKREALRPKEPGLFNGHLLQTQQIRPEVLTPDQNWVTGLFLGLLVLLTIMRRIYSKKLALIFTTFLGTATQFFREDSAVPKRLSTILWAIFIFSGSLFLYKICQIYGLTDNPLYLGHPFLAIAIILTTLSLGQIIFMYVISYIFDAWRETEEHITSIQAFYFTTGLILLPVTILAYYTQSEPQLFIKTGAALFLLAYCYRVLKGFIQGISQPGISTIHLFLYLCTLEILPVLVICKIFIPNI